MALGAVTSNVISQAEGPVFYDDVSIVGDSAYPNTGGTVGSLGLKATLQTLRGDKRQPISATFYSTGGYHVQYDCVNDLLHVFVGANAAVDTEVANGTNLSATTFKGYIVSK